MDNLLEEYAQCQSDIVVLKKKAAGFTSKAKDKADDLELIKQKIANKCNGEKYKSPKGVVLFRRVAPKVIISDEKLIPKEWFIEKITSTLSKAGIKAALNMGKKIKGASLSNGGVSMSIEIKDL